MSKIVIEKISQVTPTWLESALEKSGALLAGNVTAVRITENRGNWSTNARLSVAYSPGAKGHLPDKLFLKMVKTDLDDEFFGPSEVLYYTRDYIGLANAPVIRCYGGTFSEERQRYYLLLDDLSDTHVRAADKTPSLAYGQALAEGLAALHAHWWGAERLEQAGAPIHSPDHIQRFIDIAAPGAGHILKDYGQELDPAWVNMIPPLFEGLPEALIDRTQDARGFTLIHGDAGDANILVPRESSRPLYLIDRQPFNWSLTTWLGVYDLAYAVVLDWETATRRRLEIQVLRHYYDMLLANGVRDYSWQRLYDDYRLCVGMCAYIAVEYCRGGINEAWIDVWLPYLERSLAAIADLNCEALWKI